MNFAAQNLLFEDRLMLKYFVKNTNMAVNSRFKQEDPTTEPYCISIFHHFFTKTNQKNK